MYFPALDGLRVLAFISVFIHHLPYNNEGGAHWLFRYYGLVGVELFFTISAFLFFNLFDAELKRTGRIDIAKFYLRRCIRIYPLMVAFAFAMLALSEWKYSFFIRFIGVVAASDNLLTAYVQSYSPLKYAAHLWTLSYELQVYALIPAAYLLRRSLGVRWFFVALLGLWVGTTILRLWLLSAGASTLQVWVLPIVRPDSTVAGIVLSLVWRRIGKQWFLVAAAAGLVAFLAVPPLAESTAASAFAYPAAALMCGGLLGWSVKDRTTESLLTLPLIAYLGKISYGLYVFHLLGIAVAVAAFGRSAPVCGVAILAAAITVSLAAASFHLFETKFLRLKMR